MKIISEGSCKIKASTQRKDATKKVEVFYNPSMESNRNISVLFLNNIANKNMKIALPLAGSGIRGLRFLKEVKKGKVSELYVNDIKDNFEQQFNENLKLSEIKSKKFKIENQDANLFMLNHLGLDYIDLDPFGTPNPFLSAAVASISRYGILAVTATDTAALTGTYPQVTKRKYWSRSLRNYMMHEIGLRILIRKVQLQGIQFDKALIPVLAYHKDHYFRIYFVSLKGKEKCDALLKEHQYLLFCPKCLNFTKSNFNIGTCDCSFKFDVAGPLWIGKLFDSKLVSKMAKNNPFSEEQKFLDTLKAESKKDVFGFYDLHIIAKKFKQDPKKNEIMKKLGAVPTHFSPTGFKTEKGIKEIIKIIKKIT
jgi:tRNA (guanine26-N2/guanine27-N2)-dimethyltransferase